ncbi:NAD-dependent dehydratase, partial [Mycobacterium sp. ITM-2017-0098]
MAGTKLVIGASGFLGSHVTKQLIAGGESDVRVLIRTTSSMRGIDGLPVDIRYGDIFDTEALRNAMAGCDVVYYCVVDARPWLRDPTPMWRTNVDGLRNVLDVAVDADLRRFVFTSSIGTIGRVDGGLADEDTAHNWLDVGGAYIRSRVEAERMVLRYSAERGFPGVAMCVANTYGPGDFLPTPHGGMLAAAVRGKIPFFIDGYEAEVVGIEDAARAMILAGDRGAVGERYIVSERFMSTREVHEIGCAAVGAAPPKIGVPIRAMAAVAHLGSAAA